MWVLIDWVDGLIEYKMGQIEKAFLVHTMNGTSDWVP